MPNWVGVKGTVTGPPIVAAGTSVSGGLSLPYRYATTSLTPPSLLPFDPRVNMPVLPTPSCHMLSAGYWVDVTVGAVFGAVKLFFGADEMAVRVLITITDRELEAARTEPRLSRWVSFSSGNLRANHGHALSCGHSALRPGIRAGKEKPGKHSRAGNKPSRGLRADRIPP